MKIIADDKIPYFKGVFEPFAEVLYLPGSKITPDDLADADVLVTRTRTTCDRALLQYFCYSYQARWWHHIPHRRSNHLSLSR